MTLEKGYNLDREVLYVRRNTYARVNRHLPPSTGIAKTKGNFIFLIQATGSEKNETMAEKRFTKL